MRLFAYGSIPKDGGTFTLYKSLRQGLKPLGWDIRCVTVGAREHSGWNDAFADDGCVLIAPDETDLKRQARAFVDWCIEQNVNVMMPVNSKAMLAAIPHTPSEIRAVSRCADTTAYGYSVALYAMNRLARIVATTPRHVADMTGHYGAPVEKVVLIPHGIDLKPFELFAGRNQGQDTTLRLAYLGTLGRHKGILHIPDILGKLDTMQIPYYLSVAGSGIDRQAMESRVKEAINQGRVSFLGTIPRERVPEFLGQADILLFPSHNEGFGFVLIEAMAAGCVPVASRIRGVTGFIVEDGKTGILCPVGDAGAFADAIIGLHEDRARLREMSQAAAAAARSRFSMDRVAADYAQMLDAVVDEAPVAPSPLPWKEFRVPPPYRPRWWRDAIPRPVRLLARGLLQKLKLLDTQTYRL